MKSVLAFKQSCNRVSKAFKRIGHWMPCENCGRMVKRYPSQIAQAKHIFCSKTCKRDFYFRTYQEAKKCYEPVYLQHSIGVSFLISRALASGVDPWTLAAKEANFR